MDRRLWGGVVAGLIVLAVGYSLLAYADSPILTGGTDTTLGPAGGGGASGASTDITLGTGGSGGAAGASTDPVSDTTTTSMTVASERPESPAWIEHKNLIEGYRTSVTGEDPFGLEHERLVIDYHSNNPNDVSTPVGALCWAHHELNRALVLRLIREAVDYWFILGAMERFEITREEVGVDPGPAATKIVIGLLKSQDDHRGIEHFDDLIDVLGVYDEFGGDGTEIATALDAVAAPEIWAIVQATRGMKVLPSAAQDYADSLFALVAKQAALEVPTLDSDTQSMLDGYYIFREVAKYHPDCRRMAIHDSGNNNEEPESSTTTTRPLPSTTSTSLIPGAPGEPRNVLVSDTWTVTWDPPLTGGTPIRYNVVVVRTDHTKHSTVYEYDGHRSLNISYMLTDYAGEFTVSVQACNASIHECSSWTPPQSFTIGSTTTTTTEPTTPPNPGDYPPVFSMVSPDQTVNAGETVTLSASATDPEGTDILYRWEQTAPPVAGVTLDGVYTDTATFTAPSLSEETVLRFRVTASDLNSGQSTADVNITVRDDNDPPVVRARASASVVEGRTGHLVGSATDDWTPSSDLIYHWRQIGGLVLVTLNNADQARATFIAPDVTEDTILTFRLGVADSGGDWTSVRVTTTVRSAN